MPWSRIARHAWAAVEGMPDNDAETATRLYTTANWLRFRFPDEAERFVHALLARCPDSPEALRVKPTGWLPKDDLPAGR